MLLFNVGVALKYNQLLHFNTSNVTIQQIDRNFYERAKKFQYI